MQLLLEHCVFIQDRWCRLEPLLTSPDMLSAAPDEARKFFAIDKSWREVLTAIGQSKQIFSLIFAENMSERLASCIQQIQMLEKNLRNVMECKRQQYPRFFLLAEDELKELLSFSRDPRKSVLFSPFTDFIFYWLSRFTSWQIFDVPVAAVRRRAEPRIQRRIQRCRPSCFAHRRALGAARARKLHQMQGPTG